MGTARTTFLVDPDGRIARVWPKVKPEATPARSWPPSTSSRPSPRDAAGDAPSSGESNETSLVGETSEASASSVRAPHTARKDIPAAVRARSRRRRPHDGPPETARTTTGGPPGSWSSSPTPTTPTSGRPAPPPAGSTRAPSAGSSAARRGDQGGEDPDADPLELAALRETEQRAAAAVIGYAGVSFLHQPDGALANDLALRELLVREIRTFRPDAVLATDPEAVFHEGGGVNHTDHRAAGIAAVDAVYPAARNPMAFPALARDGLAAHAVRRLYLFWSERPDAWVDVTATLDRKLAALAEHRSQIRDPERSPSGSGAGPPRRASRSARGRGGPARHRHRRRRGRGRSRPSGRSALVEQDGPDPAPVVPDLGQAVGPPPEHRHQGAQRQVPGRVARGAPQPATSTSWNSVAISASFGQCRIRIGSRPA